MQGYGGPMDSCWPLRGAATRRELLQRGGLLAGVAALGTLGWGTTSVGATTSAVALSEERRRIYGALAETVVTGPGLRLPADAAAGVVSDFEAAYITWAAPDRNRADGVLDALGRDFEKQGRKERAGVLHPANENARAADLAYRARTLVAIAITPDGELTRIEVGD